MGRVVECKNTHVVGNIVGGCRGVQKSHVVGTIVGRIVGPHVIDTSMSWKHVVGNIVGGCRG